jgi:hypothetical protein
VVWQIDEAIGNPAGAGSAWAYLEEVSGTFGVDFSDSCREVERVKEATDKSLREWAFFLGHQAACGGEIARDFGFGLRGTGVEFAVGFEGRLGGWAVSGGGIWQGNKAIGGMPASPCPNGSVFATYQAGFGADAGQQINRSGGVDCAQNLIGWQFDIEIRPVEDFIVGQAEGFSGSAPRVDQIVMEEAGNLQILAHAFAIRPDIEGEELRGLTQTEAQRGSDRDIESQQGLCDQSAQGDLGEHAADMAA